jgi:hypothetical protein
MQTWHTRRYFNRPRYKLSKRPTRRSIPSIRSQTNSSISSTKRWHIRTTRSTLQKRHSHLLATRHTRIGQTSQHTGICVQQFNSRHNQTPTFLTNDRQTNENSTWFILRRNNNRSSTQLRRLRAPSSNKTQTSVHTCTSSKRICSQQGSNSTQFHLHGS